MLKKGLVIILTFLLFLGLISYNQSISAAIDSSFSEKLLFFTGKQTLSWNNGQIESLKQNGAILEFEKFPRLNAIRIKANDECFRYILANNPDIKIMNNFIYKSTPIFHDEKDLTQEKSGWNLDLIHVKELWEKGFTGKGIKIGILDTGADSKHPALQGKIKDFAFFSKSGTLERQKEAYDTDTHGTHVSGIAAGGSLKDPLGVAPDAGLSVGVVIPGGSGSFSQIISGLEWLLDPDNDPLTQDSPRVVNLSLGLAGYVNIWTPLFQKLLASNILPVCSIGNEGDGISSSPGNTPNAFSVGAFDQNKKAAYFSSGSDQIQWEDSIYQSGVYLKPDVSAPGVAIRSCIPGNSFELMSGTSMASPHVAGAAAVLAQAFPDASSYDLMYFLKEGSLDQGRKGPDTRFGQGSLDVENSWKLMKEAKRIYGKLKNYTPDFSLQILETGLPVYVNQLQTFSVYLPQGLYHLQVILNNSVLQTIPLQINSKNLLLDLTLPKLEAMQIRGKVKDTNGKPLLATIFTKEGRFTSDENGFFSVLCQSMEEITISSSGYKEQIVNIGSHFSQFLNITLSKTKILLIEGNSSYLSIKNPPRLARKYYFQALEQNHITFAYQNASINPIRWEDISSFELIIFFFDSGSFSYEEGNILSRYLENGGKLIISGRMVMFLENYNNLSFIGDHFGVSSKETISFPTISSMDMEGDFSNLQFSLSGNRGANNQENCDVLQKRESSINPVPFLKYNEVGKERYAGVIVTNGVYRGIFLPFGLEGIGSEASRSELMGRLVHWLNQVGSMEIRMPEGVPFYVELKKNTGFYSSTIVQTGTFFQTNLSPGNYQVLVHGFGYEKFETAQFIGVKDFVSLWINPKKTSYGQVRINLNEYKGNLSFLEVYFHHKLVLFKEFGSENSYLVDLPPGEYTLMIRSPNYETKFYQANFKPVNNEIIIDMKKNVKKVLLVDDSYTGDFLLDRYARIGDYYSKYLSSTPFQYDLWSVDQKGSPKFLDLIPYQVVLYVTGLNRLSLNKTSEQEQIGRYLEKGGRILLSGNYTHTILQDTQFLHQYFGVEVKTSNVREQGVLGAPESQMSDMSFDLSDNFSDNGIFVPFGSFEPLESSVKPLFLYYSGEYASTYFQGSSFRSIFLPFGLDNIMRSTVRLDVLNRLLKLLTSD